MQDKERIALANLELTGLNLRLSGLCVHRKPLQATWTLCCEKSDSLRHNLRHTFATRDGLMVGPKVRCFQLSV